MFEKGRETRSRLEDMKLNFFVGSLLLSISSLLALVIVCTLRNAVGLSLFTCRASVVYALLLLAPQLAIIGHFTNHQQISFSLKPSFEARKMSHFFVASKTPAGTGLSP